MFYDELFEDSLKPLRVCRVCGKEAWLESELQLFKSDIKSSYRKSLKCKECTAKAMRDKRKDNPEYHNRQKECNKTYHKKHKDRLNALNREYHHNNRDTLNQRRKEYNERNKEAVRLKRKSPENLARARAMTGERRRIKKNTLNFLTEAELKKIKSIYLQAQFLSEITDFRWDIDHIIPLKSHFVCGFHHPDNLQIIPQDINATKLNYFGYFGQYHTSHINTGKYKKPTRKAVFNSLEISMTWEDFLEYEKINYKDYV